MPIANAAYSNPSPRVHVFTETITVQSALTSAIDGYDRQVAERTCQKRFDNALTLGGAHFVRGGARDLIGRHYAKASLLCVSGALVSCLSLPFIPLTGPLGVIYDQARRQRSLGAVWNKRFSDAVSAHLADRSWGDTSQAIEKDRALLRWAKNQIDAMQERISNSVGVRCAMRRWAREIDARDAARGNG